MTKISRTFFAVRHIQTKVRILTGFSVCELGVRTLFYYPHIKGVVEYSQRTKRKFFGKLPRAQNIQGNVIPTTRNFVVERVHSNLFSFSLFQCCRSETLQY